MSRSEPTYIGAVRGLSGALVSVELRADLSSTLTMVQGESHRIGQIGSFIRIPLGYANLYGVVTQVGAAAAPTAVVQKESQAHRWLTIALFGESVSGIFERGVSQYPTIDDEAHLLTTPDLNVIYASKASDATVSIGTVSSSTGISAQIDLGRLVSRHVAVVGSTGSGKSNSVAVLLEAISTQNYPSARVIVLDAHGEYGAAAGDQGYVFRTKASKPGDRQLYVPFWALPADEFINATMGKLNATAESAVRDAIADLKRAASKYLASPPPLESITADSPIPFSARRLWFELDDYERHTLQDRTTGTLAAKVVQGDADKLVSNVYPAPSPGNAAPFVGPRRGIARPLELMRSRLQDTRLSFLFNPGNDLTPDQEGRVSRDLDSVVAAWVGHDRPITVVDISGLPAEEMSSVAGTVLRIVYDTLFWAGSAPIAGREQPLLVVLEEAHRILPAGGDSLAMRVATQIAKEGRKHGVGLMIVTQRPTELDASVLSQCGTMIALRLSNQADRSVVAGALPDDLGNLSALLPALRTGEALAVGEALRIPTRVRFRRAVSKPVGDDPDLAKCWRKKDRPDQAHYSDALSKWRRRSE